MPASVTLHDLSYSTPDNQTLFTGLNLSFGPGRTGLIGRNGTGKSTLLRIIAGNIPQASGSVTTSGIIGMLDQIVQVTGQTMADHLGVREPLATLDRLEQGLGATEDAANADWSLLSRIDETLADLGLPAFEPNPLRV
jgi:ATPase subunit of ABC transporter with duplicated ATPase domains